MYVGIEIGGSKLQVVSGRGAGKIHQRWRFSVDPRQGGAGIRRQLEEALPDIVASSDPSAIAVGFGGPVDRWTGTICCSHQVEGWADFELGKWLHGVSNRPISVENDANCAALGEAICGAGAGFNPVFYVTLGSGVGGGLVVDRAIYHGAKPGEAEIGHLRLDREGTIVENRCSGWAVDRKIRRLKDSGVSSALCELTRNVSGAEARFLSEALKQNDAAALRILRETAEDLAFALSHVTHLFHPAVVVLGGGLSLVGEPLRAAVAEALPKFIMEVFQPGPSIRLAALGEDSVPVGAMLLAEQRQKAGQP